MAIVRILLSFLVVFVSLRVEMSEATVFQVGDSAGWGIPSNTDFYDNWKDDKVFRVGDQMVFNWTTGHDVAKVSEAQYDSCTASANVSSTTGPFTYNLTTIGDHYFICTIGTHCSRGQKLDIEVVAATPSPPPPPSNTTSGSAPTPSNTPSSTTSPPPPPPPSASPTFGPLVALSATLSVLAFFLS